MRAKRPVCRLAVTLALAVGALVVPASTSVAGTFTDNLHIDYPPVTYVTDVPCIGPVELTDTLSLVVHDANTSRNQHFGEALSGEMAIDPLDPSLPTYTGTYTGHLNIMRVNGATRVLSSTLSIMLRGSDGSTLHLVFVEHVTIDADGDVTKQISNIRCT